MNPILERGLKLAIPTHAQTDTSLQVAMNPILERGLKLLCLAERDHDLSQSR